jgi:uncharacterized delta-60 repeat protein
MKSYERLKLVRGVLIVLGCTALLASGAPSAHAAPGDLDPSFGGFSHDGVATQYGYPMDGGERGMAIQPDGKIVMAGYTSLGILVMRYLPDGTPDPTFGGGDGAVALLHPSVVTRATDVAIQADGRIVVAGWADTGPADYMLARLTPSGYLDPSFGSGGWVLTDFSDDTDQAYSVVIQSDGKIIAAGRSLIGNDYDFSAARYNPNGTLDMSFGGDGLVTVGFGKLGPDNNEACYDIALDSSGRLVMVGGGTDVWTTGTFDIARLTTSGSLDVTFNTFGRKHWDVGPDNTQASAVAIAPDGKIVVAGSQVYFNSSQSGEAYAARFLPNGDFDNSFDDDGKLKVSDNYFIRDVVVQPDGRILLLGDAAFSASQCSALFMRLALDGSRDPTFSDNGTYYSAESGYCKGYDLALLPDGRLLAYGAKDQNHLLVQLWPDGTLDVAGKQAIGFDTPGFGAGTYSIGYGMAIQPDEKIIVAGTVYGPAGDADFGLARVFSTGRIDDTFGTYGRATFAFDEDDLGTCVALQSDGKIIMAGDTQNGSDRDFMVVRFNPDGSVDGSFGFLGFSVLDFLGGDDYGRAIAIAPDGKIVVVGAVFNGARNVFGVARFNSNGTPDTSFDIDGKQLVEFAVGPTHWASSVAVLPDNRILVGGSVGGDFALARLNVDGSLDTTFGSAFGGSGRRTYDFGGNDYLNALKLSSGGAIYAAGSSEIAGHTVFAMLQLPSHGGPPTCFPTPCPWPSGQATVDWGASVNGAAYAIDLSDDGQVLVGGIAGGKMAWAQVPASSTPMPILGMADFPGASDTATGISFTSLGKLVASGYYDQNGVKALALASFETTFNAVSVPDDGTTRASTQVRFLSAYPNPASGRTLFDFELPSSGTTRVSVYDLAGRRVRVLANEPLAAGRHELAWDTNDSHGRPVAAGIYLARVEFGTFHAQKKIIVFSR